MIEKRNICVFGERLANHIKLFPRRFALGIFLDRIELPGDICHHRVNVITSFDPGRGEETVGQAIEIGLCEHDRRSRLHDVAVEISPEFGQFLAQLFDFFALVAR